MTTHIALFIKQTKIPELKKETKKKSSSSFRAFWWLVHVEQEPKSDRLCSKLGLGAVCLSLYLLFMLMGPGAQSSLAVQLHGLARLDCFSLSTSRPSWRPKWRTCRGRWSVQKSHTEGWEPLRSLMVRIVYFITGAEEGGKTCLVLRGNVETEMWEVLSHIYYYVCLKGGNA